MEGNKNWWNNIDPWPPVLFLIYWHEIVCCQVCSKPCNAVTTVWHPRVCNLIRITDIFNLFLPSWDESTESSLTCSRKGPFRDVYWDQDQVRWNLLHSGPDLILFQLLTWSKRNVSPLILTEIKVSTHVKLPLLYSLTAKYLPTRLGLPQKTPNLSTQCTNYHAGMGFT